MAPPMVMVMVVVVVVVAPMTVLPPTIIIVLMASSLVPGLWQVRSHTIKCSNRMDNSYQNEPLAVLASTRSYKLDPNWYNDASASAMDHITSDFD